VAPGQCTEAEILANRHGSPAYARFMKNLGRVIKIRDELEVYTGGLQADKHGDYALAWWDDIGQILFHVATFMPNLETPGQSSVFHKKAEIGNIHVKIVWNDSGKPFQRETIVGAFNHINIVIEPHTLTTEAVHYQDNYHTHGYFKVLLQVDPSLPRITSIGEFKLVSMQDLARTVRNYALIACLFCTSWLDTGEDGPVTIPINTNWQERLKLINRSERLLSKEPEMDYSLYGLPVSMS
jgi:tuberous sclerosis 2